MLETELQGVPLLTQFHLEITLTIVEHITQHFHIKVSQQVNFILYLEMKFSQKA